MEKKVTEISKLMEKMTFAEFQDYMDSCSTQELQLILSSAWGYIEGTGLVKIKEGRKK